VRKISSIRREPTPTSAIIVAGGFLESHVLMSVLVVAATGVLLGLRYKAPALIAATALLVLGSFAWNGLGFPGSVTVANFLILVFSLTCAYLVGLSLAVALRRDAGKG
jgi:hypothetical protein